MFRSRKGKVVLLGTLMMALLVTACGGNSGGSTENDKSSESGNTASSISLLRPSWNNLRPASKDLWMWQEYEKMSGVQVEWEELSDIGEKKNVILTRKQLPDAFYQVDWSNGELLKYGQQGLFIPLEDLIKEHAPNLQKLLDENEDIRKGLTSADGHIYATPYLDPYPEGNRTIRLYINKKWLDNLGMEVPKTTAELEEALNAFVTQDPNGNGVNDEQGWYMPSGSLGWTFEQMMMGSFGIGNGGRKALGNFIYVDDKDEIQLTITSDGYKEVLKYENRMYESGAINKQAFSGVDYDKWTADAAKDTVGAWNWAAPDYIGESVKNDFVPINVLAGPNGATASLTDSQVAGASSLVITKDAKDPGAILKWVDYFYSEEGSVFGYLGKEGVTYNMEDGNMVYIDEILNYKDGIGLGAFQYVDNVYGGYFPYIELSPEIRAAAGRQEAPVYTDLTEETLPGVTLPDLPATQEEANESSSIMADLGNYVGQMRVEFVTGTKDIDQEWDNYIAQLKKMGSDKYLQIKQEQYKRYKES
ncbi:extracellular solute-binding protein [Paenibacillus apis]|uniref:ABC transporter substrate-binding protein n=1 Tax=Paenibacillus apis TaxID=1792174 RepID=A0A919XYP7_9BACL|nr:extracellular solute-binding protein [Paenibacillus apis]GIO40484.1 ABC transporter substrate-binding protein [Paenibacillus apis]